MRRLSNLSPAARRQEWLAEATPSAVNEHAQEHPIAHGLDAAARGLLRRTAAAARDPLRPVRDGTETVPSMEQPERGGAPEASRPRGWTVNEIPSTPGGSPR